MLATNVTNWHMIWPLEVHDNNVVHSNLTSVSLHFLSIGDPLNMITEQRPNCCRWVAPPFRFRFLEYRQAIEPEILLLP